MKRPARNKRPGFLPIQLQLPQSLHPQPGETELAELRRQLTEHADEVQRLTLESQMNQIADAIAADLAIQKSRRTKSFPTLRLSKR